MKTFIFLFGILISLKANSEIFKCKDVNNKVSYQSIPCSITTVGKVRKDADIPEADRIRAQERVDNFYASERAKKEAEEREIAARQEKVRELQLQKEARAIENKKLKLLERQAIAAEQGAIEASRARVAAERAQDAAEDARRASQINTPAQTQRLRCRPDYAGGLICD